MDQFRSEKLALNSTLIKEPYFITDPMLYETYKKCLVPEEIHNKKLKEKDIIEPDENPFKTCRFIYEKVELSDFEKEWVKKLDEEICEKQVKITGCFSDGEKLRWLYAYSFNIENVVKMIESRLNWQSSFFPLNLTPSDKVIQLLNSGCIYCFGRDSACRPIIILQPYLYSLKEQEYYSVDDQTQAVLFFCEFLCKNMLLPGKIEKWNIIINCQGTGIASVNQRMKKLMLDVGEFYPERLFRMYIINMPLLFSLIYTLVCAVLDKATVRKFHKIDEENI